MKRMALLAFLVFASAASAQYGLPRLPAVRPGAVPPDVPAAAPDPEFRLRVHLLTARWGGLGGVYHGYGSGNLLEANAIRGFDYGFECDLPFVENEGPADTYQARWKRAPYQLEILTAEVGVDQPRARTCTLRLVFTERPFEPANTAALSHGVSSSLRKRWQDPDFAYEEPALDYPIHSTWSTANAWKTVTPIMGGAPRTSPNRRRRLPLRARTSVTPARTVSSPTRSSPASTRAAG